MNISNATAAFTAKAVSFDTNTDTSDSSTNDVRFKDIMNGFRTAAVQNNPASDPIDTNSGLRTAVDLPQNSTDALADATTSISSGTNAPKATNLVDEFPFDLKSLTNSAIATSDLVDDTPSAPASVMGWNDIAAADRDRLVEKMAVAPTSNDTSQSGASVMEHSLNLLLSNQFDIADASFDRLETLRNSDS